MDACFGQSIDHLVGKWVKKHLRDDVRKIMKKKKKLNKYTSLAHDTVTRIHKKLPTNGKKKEKKKIF